MQDITLYLTGLRHLRWRLVGESVLESFGVLWAAVEIGAFFSTTFSAALKPYWWAFLLLGLGAGLWRSFPRLATACRVNGTDCDIEIRVCDVLSLDGDVIVGANTTFDTAIEDKTISVHSVQGQFTKQFCSSVDQLDRELENALQQTPSVEIPSAEKPYGKRRRFDVGTVASVQCDKKNAFFVAIATLNEHRVASASRQDVLDALPRLWEHVRTRGSMSPLVCPILGSGFARVNSNRNHLTREIIRSFIAAGQAGRFTEKLTIAVSPADYRASKVDLQGLARFLEHECSEANAAARGPGDSRVGVPVDR